MNGALDIAVIALGTSNLAAIGAAAYAVRRVAPWPKPPAPPGQSQGGTRTAGAPADTKVPAVNGSPT